jgi:uncharacterized membrane protein required for colicin V production
MKGFVLGAATGALLVSVFSVCMLACSGNKQQDLKTAKDIVKLTEQACVVVEDVAPANHPANSVCAKEEELRPYINLILGARKAPKAAVEGGTAAVPDASK